MLVVLDANATPFTRIWCAFEEATAVTMDPAERPEKARLLLDIATAATGGAELLIDGLSPGDERAEAKFLKYNGLIGESGWLVKSKREVGFPLDVVRVALKITVECAQASRPEDRIHILNVIAERSSEDLDLDPVSGHHKYGEADRILRSIFAEAAMRKAIAEGVDITDASGKDDEGAKLELLKALREGKERHALRFTFSGLESFRATDLHRVADNLPLTLLSLTLDLNECKQLANVDGLQGLGGLTALQSLTLDLGQRCQGGAALPHGRRIATAQLAACS